MKGRDPILLEDVDITEWISKTDDNFVLVLPNKKRLCLKKSYFLNPQINDLYLNCSLKKGNLIGLMKNAEMQMMSAFLQIVVFYYL